MILFKSFGTLFVINEDGSISDIQSTYAKNVQNKALENYQKNEWKTAKKDNALISGRSLWGVKDSGPLEVQATVTGFCKGYDENQIIYALDTSRVGGIFSYDTKNKEEQRLFHQEFLHVRDFAFSSIDKPILCSVRKGGVQNIALLKKRCSFLEEITEGDSFDVNPCWCSEQEDVILFQSAGLARNSFGTTVLTDNAEILMLNLENGKIETLVSEKDYDFVLPKMLPDGMLYYIRRPYERDTLPTSSLLKDFFFLPFRLFTAVFGFLNAFSMFFTQNPLTTAGGPAKKGPEMSKILLQDRMVEIKREMNFHKIEETTQTIVPKSWQLCRINKNGGEEIIDTSVLAFDFMADGTLVYTNGTKIYMKNKQEKKNRIHVGKLVEGISVI